MRIIYSISLNKILEQPLVGFIVINLKLIKGKIWVFFCELLNLWVDISAMGSQCWELY